MSYDGSDRKQIRRREKENAIREANRVAYTKRIMADLPGREWMHDLLAGCNVFHTPFVRAGADATAYNCGRQAIGLTLFADVVNHCPREYVQMMIEATAKDTVDERRNNDNRSTDDERSGDTEPDGGHQGSVNGGDYDPYNPSIN